MFYGTLLFLIGFGAVMTRCSADRLQDLNASGKICAPRFNLSDIGAALSVITAGTADDYTLVTEQQVKCFVDCIERETGVLNADDEFNLSKCEGKIHSYCARTVENWDLWDRTNKCLKGYLFFKCAVYGEAAFNGYMDIQSKIASGELKPRGRY